MLLEHDETRVASGDYRVHDYVIARLELRSLGVRRCPTSTIYAYLTLGNTGIPHQAVGAGTNGVSLNEIEGFEEIHEAWRALSAKGGYDQGFLDYLLRYFRSTAEVSIEFSVEEEKIKNFSVRLGKKIVLLGRFSEDVDVLGSYFGSTLHDVMD